MAHRANKFSNFYKFFNSFDALFEKKLYTTKKTLHTLNTYIFQCICRYIECILQIQKMQIMQKKRITANKTKEGYIPLHNL